MEATIALQELCFNDNECEVVVRECRVRAAMPWWIESRFETSIGKQARVTPAVVQARAFSGADVREAGVLLAPAIERNVGESE